MGISLFSSIEVIANALCFIMDNDLQIMRGQSNESNIGSARSDERLLMSVSCLSLWCVAWYLTDRSW